MSDRLRPLSALFDRVGAFASLLDGYDQRLITAIDETDAENLNMTGAEREHYFHVGADVVCDSSSKR